MEMPSNKKTVVQVPLDEEDLGLVDEAARIEKLPRTEIIRRSVREFAKRCKSESTQRVA
jgi:hypothetical protein